MTVKKIWIILILLCFLWTMDHGPWTNCAEANVILKAVVVNPSKTKTQKALLKAYLPKEATPEDVVELGDLKIDYDIEKTLYYVYKEFELSPGESAVRAVEINDVWVIPGEKLNDLVKRTKELVDSLQKTRYALTSQGMQEYVETKIKEIQEKQEKAKDAMPQTHIAAYRDNAKGLEGIEDTVAKLEQMVIEHKFVYSIPGTSVSVKATWWVILGVIIALGILSTVFFVIWQRQLETAQAKQKEDKAAATDAKAESLPEEEDKE